ncbi:GspH/FimT family pseudopilin [Haloferula sargassicola]|uniref:Type II secretion system protein H n=1 Tax=Haloferula sargassicola TaxID=490096 RepID=A0ABP9UH93_9BACT
MGISQFHAPTGPASRRAGRVAGFTLIEMIAVVCIMATLVAVGMGLFQRTGSEAVKTGTEKFAAMVEQARTTAITRRKPVALALVSPGEAGLGDEQCRLGLFELEEWEANQPVTGSQVQRWEALPGGVGFDSGAFESLSNAAESERVSLTWKNGAEKAELPMLVFSSRGALLSPSGSQPVVVILSSGVHQHGRFIPREGGGRRIVRIGRVVARPWILDV